MAKRYNNNNWVIGVDLRNEIRPDIQIEGTFRLLPIPQFPKLVIRLPTWSGGDRMAYLSEVVPEVLNYTNSDLSWKSKFFLSAFKAAISRTRVYLHDWKPVATETANKV